VKFQPYSQQSLRSAERSYRPQTATHMGAAETKAGHEEEYVDGTSAAPWPQLDGVTRPTTSPALDDGRRSEDGEGRGGAKSNNISNSNCGYR